MGLQDSVISREYLNELREYRDIALAESYYSGTAIGIGQLTCGLVRARWEAQNGGVALLTNRGFYWGAVPILRKYPTKLTIIDDPLTASASTGQSYFVDADSSCGEVAVQKTYHVSWTRSEEFSIMRAFLEEQKLGLHLPSEQDTADLLQEMKRGASGMYQFDPFLLES